MLYLAHTRRKADRFSSLDDCGAHMNTGEQQFDWTESNPMLVRKGQVL